MSTHPHDLYHTDFIYLHSKQNGRVLCSGCVPSWNTSVLIEQQVFQSGTLVFRLCVPHLIEHNLFKLWNTQST